VGSFGPANVWESLSVFCKHCGKPVAEGAYFCAACGKDLTTPAATPGAVTTVPTQTSGKAIASLVLGFFSFFPLTAIIGVILGHLSLSDIRKSAGRLGGKGLAIAGLVMGYLGLAAIPFILIIAAIAIPNLLRARMAANEASAVSGIRILDAAEVGYSVAHPDRGFSCSLEDLAETAGANIDRGLASGSKHGYVFLVQNCSSEAPGGPNSRYQVVAYPQTKGTTGVRAFCSDESMVIKADAQGAPQDCIDHGSPL
jgi:hypothetical protein